MPKYESFAQVYDQMMNDVPYEDWALYLEGLWKKFGASPKMVLDLGCGTGNMTQLLATKGYEMIGIDLSEEMLCIAKEKARTAELDILYLQQDMTEFELYGTVDSIIAVCDSMNYILDDEELIEVFRKADNYLEPGGLFIFDMNTAYKFEEIYQDQTFAEVYEDSAYIWKNYYYEEEAINEYDLTLFIQGEASYQRFHEVHNEKAYDAKVVVTYLESVGLKVEGVFDAFTYKKATNKSERLYFVAREMKK